MSVKNTTDVSKIVDLAKRRVPAHEGAFGASILRDDGTALPANEQALGFLDKLIVDESLPLYVTALDGTIMHMNDAYVVLDAMIPEASLAAGPSEAALGRRVASLTPVIEDVLAQDATVRAEETVMLGADERIYIGRHIPVRNEKREIIAVAGTYEDVTFQVKGIEEANKTQARFQDFARASSDWFFECGEDMKIKSMSDRFTAIVGQPASLFIGARFEQFGTFQSNLDGRSEASTAIKNRKSFRDQLFVLSGPDGKELLFHLSAVPVFNRKTGDFGGYRGVGMDVTERYKQARSAEDARTELEKLLTELTRKNMALDQATEQATSALKTRNEFLAAMSHELRTPLNAIIGFAGSFEDQSFGVLDEAYVSFAGDIRKSGEHLLSLINDILDVATLESGGLTLRIDTISLDNTLNKAVSMILERAEQKSLDVSALKTSSAMHVRADDRRTTQIFINLLSNAVKFTPSGGKVGIDIDEIDGMAHITVWDTGIGISEENQEKVFEKFQQVTEHFYSRQQEGTGLGMHISRQFARKMGGDITLTSVEDAGSRFTFTVPVADTDSDIEDDDFI